MKWVYIFCMLFVIGHGISLQSNEVSAFEGLNDDQKVQVFGTAGMSAVFAFVYPDAFLYTWYMPFIWLLTSMYWMWFQVDIFTWENAEKVRQELEERKKKEEEEVIAESDENDRISPAFQLVKKNINENKNTATFVIVFPFALMMSILKPHRNPLPQVIISMFTEDPDQLYYGLASYNQVFDNPLFYILLFGCIVRQYLGYEKVQQEVKVEPPKQTIQTDLLRTESKEHVVLGRAPEPIQVEPSVVEATEQEERAAIENEEKEGDNLAQQWSNMSRKQQVHHTDKSKLDCKTTIEYEKPADLQDRLLQRAGNVY